MGHIYPLSLSRSPLCPSWTFCRLATSTWPESVKLRATGRTLGPIHPHQRAGATLILMKGRAGLLLCSATVIEVGSAEASGPTNSRASMQAAGKFHIHCTTSGRAPNSSSSLNEIKYASAPTARTTPSRSRNPPILEEPPDRTGRRSKRHLLARVSSVARAAKGDRIGKESLGGREACYDHEGEEKEGRGEEDLAGGGWRTLEGKLGTWARRTRNGERSLSGGEP